MPFHPWVGRSYKNGAFFGQRILLVGESHYGSDDINLTKEVVRQVCEGARYRFFTSVGYAVAGRAAYDADPSRFWNSVAFMNFVDESVGDKAADRPTEDMLKRAKATILDRMHALNPDRVLVFSDLSWKYLPPFSDGTDGMNFYPPEPEMAWFGYYTMPHGPAPTMYARHPSWPGWKADFWRGLIARFLTEPLPQPGVNPSTVPPLS